MIFFSRRGGSERALGWLTWLQRLPWLHDLRRRAPLQAALATRYDAAAESIVVSDLNDIVVYANAAAQHLIGIPNDLLLGRDCQGVLPLFNAAGEPYDRFALTPAPGASTVSILRVPGQAERPLAVRIAPLRDMAGGASARVVGIVTSLCDGQAQLHDLAELGHAADVLAGSTDAIIGLDGDLIVRYWNAGARRLLSYHDDDIIGESILLLVSTERRHALQQLLTVACEGGQINDRDVTIRNCDGRDIDVSLSAFVKRSKRTYATSVVPARGVSAAEVVVVLRDIDVRRIAERRVRHLGAQLVRRAQELQAIFDIAPVGMVIADSPDCVHLRSNLALARVLGKERASDVVLSDGASYAFWRDGVPLPPEMSPLHMAVAQRAVIDPIELEIRVQGRISTMIAYAAPVIDQDDTVVGAIAVFVDITTMKRVHAEHQYLLAEAITARATAEDASRLKEEFLATVSHELRTPLNAMHGWLEIMHRKPDPQTQARGLDVIRRNVRAQTRVIEDILDVSAFVTGKTRLSPRPIDLVEVVRAAVESMRPTAEAKSITLTLHCEVASAPVTGDFERLQQITWNLLSNAVKFTQSGGQVSLLLQANANVDVEANANAADLPLADVRAARGDPQWVVSVSDSGEGIDAGFLPYVFDRFRQADSSVERRHPGLGLGLAIVRHLVELHGGHVAVESLGRGHGATFHVHLPAAVDQAASAESAPAAAPFITSTSASAGAPSSAPTLAPTSAPTLAPTSAPTSADDAVPGATSAQAVPVAKERGLIVTSRASDGDGSVHARISDDVQVDKALAMHRLGGMDVLLVEDDPSAADMLSFALRDDGATVRVTHSAAAAWEALLVRRPDAIVSDIGMPERDGCSLLRAWRDAEATQGLGRVFAVAVTAYARTEDRERALQAGFDAFLTKPIVPSMVTSLLIERLGIHFAVNQ